MSGQELDLKTPAGVEKLIEAYNVTSTAPQHVDHDQFVGMALSYVRQDWALRQALRANSESFILALRQIAAMGHMPDKKHAAIVAYKSRKATGGWTIEAVEMWKGVVQRIFRAGGVHAIHIVVGRERDPVLRFNPTRMRLPLHEYDEFASPQERGPLKAVYAWADMLSGGTSGVAWLNRHDIARIRAESASVKFAKEDQPEGGNFWGPAWPAEGPNTPGMWKKSAAHRLEGIVPSSAEYRWEMVAPENQAVGRAVPEPLPGEPPRSIAYTMDGEAAPRDPDADPHSTLGRDDPSDPPRPTS